MKYTLSVLVIIFLFLIACPHHILATNGNQLITELKVFDNDSTYRYDYVYDSYANKVLETRFVLNNDAWYRRSQTEWKYDQTLCLYQIERVWTNAAWTMTYTIDYNRVNGLLMTETHNALINNASTPIRKIVYEYNGTQLKSKKQYEYPANAWTLSLQTDYGYSQATATDTVTNSTYTDGIVAKQYQSVNNYTANGLVTVQLMKEKGPNSTWVNFKQIYWYYRPNSTQIQSERIKTWNADNSAWEYQQKTDFEYNTANQLVSETYQYWKLLFWEDDTRYTYSYDESNRLLKKTLVKPIYHKWRNMVSINYSDFTNDKAGLMESKYEFWGGNTGEAVTSYIAYDFNNTIAINKGTKITIEYVPLDTLQGLPKTSASRFIPVYPNPSTGIYYIDTQLYDVQQWVVSDMSGRILQQATPTFSSGVIDISKLPQGVYLLKVRTADALLTQKLIKK